MSVNLLAIRERAEAATEGPWFWTTRKLVGGRKLITGLWSKQGALVVGQDKINAERLDVYDANFIEHAREDVLALLDEVELRTDRVRRAAADLIKAGQHVEDAETERDAALAEVDRLNARLEFWWTQLDKSSFEYICAAIAISRVKRVCAEAEGTEVSVEKILEALSGP